MAKFNIYRIHKDLEEALLSKFSSVGLSLAGSVSKDGYRLKFFISNEPEEIDIWWTNLYESFLRSVDKKPKNRAYFAALLASTEEICYAVSMGKSHFYLKDYCDTDFGINLAERISSGHLKLKNSKLFGGRRNKIITSYQENSDLEYDSGESIHYVKTGTVDKDRWGKSASFGNSVLLHLDIGPTDLPELIMRIEQELKKEPRIPLPRATAVQNKDEIADLDRRLIAAIQALSNAKLEVAEATVSGVDFIFLDASEYCLRLRGKPSGTIARELDLQALRDYIAQHDIDLSSDLNNIRIRVSSETNRGYTKPLKHFLDYVDDERHFLFDGKWHRFNQNYIDYLKQQADQRIRLVIQSDTILSNEEFHKWRDTLSEAERRSKGYAEYYFNKMREQEGYLLFDRHIETLRGKYKLEKMDLYKEECLFFVKIGPPQKLSYVVDQAMLSIAVFQKLVEPILIDGKQIRPKQICLWLILSRQGQLTKLSEMRSLIFLMKLVEWQKQCLNAGYEPIVRISYRVDAGIVARQTVEAPLNA